jgi:hypothetical protein
MAAGGASSAQSPGMETDARERTIALAVRVKWTTIARGLPA